MPDAGAIRDLPPAAADGDARARVAAAVARASAAIPPLWPLASSVAVNPFLGQADETLAAAAARWRRVAGVPSTMPRAWYCDRIDAGEITEADLAAAGASVGGTHGPLDARTLAAAAREPAPAAAALPTVADLARRATGIDWPALVAERIGHWATSHFDAGQALWAAPRGVGAWTAWRSVAARDLTPEIMGLRGFAARVADTPADPLAAIAGAVERLGLVDAALETYFHQLLASLGGYAQYARYLSWQAGLAGGEDATLGDLLAVRIVWEAALLDQHAATIAGDWRDTVDAHAQPPAPSPSDRIDEALQEALERASQRRFAAMLAAQARGAPAAALRVQAAFCIDVRSEVFRRALESLDPGIATLGFAGFFGLPVAHRRYASDVVEAHCPVLLNPTVPTRAGDATASAAEQGARIGARARRAWGRFKLAAISSFAFVEAAGPTYVGKLLRDALGRAPAAAAREPAPHPVPALDLDARVAAAAAVLQAMSLTAGFARLVLVVGHGATTVNNPHASALHCGACGGYSGEVNARLLAGLLNDPEVRAGLVARGIAIPSETWFVGALHDTTTDAVTLYDDDRPAPSHARDLAQTRDWLAAAGALARGERALRLPRAANADDVARRARDWSEVRPEWALAGCEAFVAAPRRRTAGLDLGGRVFLHDYAWRGDAGFGVLELILTAPVVVASWIGLQYYGSCVAPALFGGGNKLLHNVAGGIGVVEGNGGLLRAGLPWQSVHDGERLVHVPRRLSVWIEAPRDAITAVLERHPGVRALFDHRWLSLHVLDDDGRAAWRYAGGLRWVEADAGAAARAAG